MKRIIVLPVVLAAVTAFAGSPASAAASRACTGKAVRTVPGSVVMTADRFRAQKSTSCAFARYLVRKFMTARATDFDCAAASSNAGTACVIRDYECRVYEPRAFCMNQGWGVT